VGGNSVIDLGLVKNGNGIPNQQVVTVLGNTHLTAADFDFSAGKVIVAPLRQDPTLPVSLTEPNTALPLDDDPEDAAQTMLVGIQDPTFNDAIII